jgi:predicted lipid carrier protein YhbT
VATAEECRQALEKLTSQIADMDPKDRDAFLADRELSCTVTDLGVTFLTHIRPDGASPVTVANGSDPPAQVRFSVNSDDLVAIADDPSLFIRFWLTGRLKAHASFSDILRLRKIVMR